MLAIALQSLPANIAGFYLTLIPVFGIAAAFVFLGEALSGAQWIGATLIIASASVVSHLQKERCGAPTLVIRDEVAPSPHLSDSRRLCLG